MARTGKKEKKKNKNCFLKEYIQPFLKNEKKELSLKPIFIFNLVTHVTSALIILPTQVQFTVCYTQTAISAILPHGEFWNLLHNS